MRHQALCLPRTTAPVLTAPESLKTQALATPAQKPNFAQAARDIKAERQADALIDAKDALRDLQERLAGLKALHGKNDLITLLYGSDAAWRQALSRMGVAVGRQLSAVETLRVAAGTSPSFGLSEIESRTTRGYTGD